MAFAVWHIRTLMDIQILPIGYVTCETTLTFDAMNINGNYHSTQIHNRTKHFHLNSNTFRFKTRNRYLPIKSKIKNMDSGQSLWNIAELIKTRNGQYAFTKRSFCTSEEMKRRNRNFVAHWQLCVPRSHTQTHTHTLRSLEEEKWRVRYVCEC